MAEQKVSILLQIKDQATTKLKSAFSGLRSSVNSFGESFRRNWLPITAAITLTTLAVKKFSETIITASSSVEQMQVKLTQLLGSAEEGTKVFNDMANLASRVPKTYQEIMQASTQLAGVVKNGSQEINQLMPMIVDISAATGMSVQEVTGQMIRMYSAGAASADMFRERGVSAALGFKAGVAYTNEETMQILNRQWEEGFGKFVGASDLLAQTFEGKVSMMQDAWFNFKVSIGDKVFQSLKIDMQAILDLINDWKADGDKYKQTVDNIASAMTEVYNNAVKTMGFLIVSGGQVVDIWNEFESAISNVMQSMAWLSIKWQETVLLVGGMFGSEEEKLAREESLEMTKLYFEELKAIADEARVSADIDYSTEIEIKLQKLMAELQQRKALIAASATEEKEIKLNADKALYAEKAKLSAADTKKQDAEQKKVTTAYQTSSTSMLQSISTFFSLAQGESKKYAGIIKGLGIAEALINTAVGVTRAYKDYMFPVSLAVAASVAAAGAAQIATIASQGFATGTDNVPAMLSSGEMVVPRSFASAVRAGDITIGGQGGGGDVTVNIDRADFSKEQDLEFLFQGLSDSINEQRRSR